MIEETNKGYILTFGKVSYIINEATIKVGEDYILTKDKYYLYQKAIDLKKYLEESFVK